MKQAKYQEIAAKVSAKIDSGEYVKGAKLPTHRELAQQLHTTAVTVAKAYQLLVEQQRIESFVGRGSFVIDEQLSNVIQVESAALNFSILQPCIKHSGQQLKNMLINSIQASEQASLSGYIEQTGLIKHRAAGALWCRQYGLDVALEEDILLTNGAQNALSSLIQAYTKEGDCIATERYTYPGILSICKYLRRQVIAIDMDSEGMLADALDEQCEKHKPAMVIIVPSQQNPTAATMSNNRRMEIAGVIAKQRLWLVEDDIYAFLNTQPLTPISNIIPEQSFYISSLSKAVMPGLRCGYVKVPTAQRSKLIDFIRSMLWLVPPFMFEAASEMINTGQAFKWARSQQIIAKQRQQLVGEYFKHYNLSRQETSYSCWVTLPKQWSAKRFTQEAKNNGVLVSDSSYFSLANDIAAIRLSVMAIDSDERFIEGLKLLDNLLRSK